MHIDPTPTLDGINLSNLTEMLRRSGSRLYFVLAPTREEALVVIERKAQQKAYLENGPKRVKLTAKPMELGWNGLKNEPPVGSLPDKDNHLMVYGDEPDLLHGLAWRLIGRLGVDRSSLEGNLYWNYTSEKNKPMELFLPTPNTYCLRIRK